MAGTDNALRASKESRRNARLRLACERCQRRKIRCDGQSPSCGSCQRASVECVMGDSARMSDYSRAQISKLKSRVSWLENIVRHRCPDIDLTQESSLEVDLDGDNALDETIHVEASPTPVVGNGQTTQREVVSNRPQPEASTHTTGLLSHEIGLVSLNSSQDPRYIGPSSGHFLARLMLAPGRRGAFRLNAGRLSPPHITTLPTALVESLQGPLPLPSLDQAMSLATAYFEIMHPQYPILHPPSFMADLVRAYEDPNSQREFSLFHIFMVLALGATVLSQQHKVKLPAESYSLAALEHFDRLNIDNSLQGLQSLLLLLIFTLHCPNMRLNIWYLNYQCIAAVLDLGLQRNITTSSGITELQQHLRTRIFWVVMMLDRQIATMMGRPIGLRDEACDLRLPEDVDDSSLSIMGAHASLAVLPHSTTTTLQFSIHLFKLTKLNSEIKYVANSVVRDAPKYAYPAVMDINDWHQKMLQQLEQWSADTPTPRSTPVNSSEDHMTSVCRSRYLNLKMVLLRPSPAIPNPSTQSLTLCHETALETLSLYSRMYKENQLVHSWLSFYSVVLSMITLLYCVKAEPELAKAWASKPDGLLIELGKGLSVLSATGEHWSGAKRCRDILEELGRNLAASLKSRDVGSDDRGSSRRPEGALLGVHADLAASSGRPPSDPTTANDGMGVFSTADTAVLPAYPDFEDGCFDMFGSDGLFGDENLLGDANDLDAAMRSLFDDFIPTYSTTSIGTN